MLSFFAQAKLKDLPVAAQQSPFVFTENVGQLKTPAGKAKTDIDYILHTKGLDIFIGKGTLSYQWANTQHKNITTYRMDVALLQCNTNTHAASEEIQPYYENYFLPGQDNAITARTCKRIVYKDIYPGIDWALYISPSNTLEYDFIVHQTGHADDIRIQYNGATKLALKHGTLHAQTPFGTISEQSPYTYNAVSKQKISSSFRLRNNVLSFNVARHSGNFIIDPILKWGTYYGGNDDETFNAMITDKAGDLYIAGYAGSKGNIATGGSFKDTLMGKLDALLVKFTSTGQRLWSTYYGGADTDAFTALACDKYGDIYAAGYTKSQEDIATTKGYIKQLGKKITDTTGIDNFLVKFNASGQRIWSTYYGGDTTEARICAVVCDTEANVYLAGGTNSTNRITTAVAWRNTFINYYKNTQLFNNTEQNGYIAKFDSAGHIMWGTYYGMNGTAFTHMLCDKQNNIYASGFTMQDDSSCGPGLPDDSLSIASTDAYMKAVPVTYGGFITKFDPNGNRLWGTFYTQVSAMLLDDSNHLYVTGRGTSLTRFNATDGSFNWAAPNIPSAPSPTGMAFANGYIIMAGTAYNRAEAAPGNYQDLMSGGVDGYISMYDTAGRRMGATLYGGELDDYINAIVATDSGDVIVAGQTRSNEKISTAGSHQETYSNGQSQFRPDGIIARFRPDDTSLRCYVPKKPYCPGDTMMVSIITSAKFDADNVFTIELRSPDIKWFDTTRASLHASGSCTIPLVIPINQTPCTTCGIILYSSAPATKTIDGPSDINIVQGPYKPKQVSSGPSCLDTPITIRVDSCYFNSYFYWEGPNNYYKSSFSPYKVLDTPYVPGTYIVTAHNGNCTTKDTIEIVAYPRTKIFHISANTSNVLCAGDSLRLTTSDTFVSGLKYYWSGPDNFADTNLNIALKTAGTRSAGLYKVKSNMPGCGADSTYVTVYDYPPIPDMTSNSPVFTGDALELYAVNEVSQLHYTWTGPNGFYSTAQFPVIPQVTPAAAGIYTVTAEQYNCSTSSGIDVTVIDKNTAIKLYPNPCKGILHFDIHTAIDQEIPITISDAVGRKVYQDITATSGKALFKTITLSHLATGQYYFHAEADGKHIDKTFMLNR